MTGGWLLLSDDELEARLIQRGVRDVNARALVKGREQGAVAEHITLVLEGDGR